ncbi:MAG: hypothetical protein WBA57_27525 [Elainellaceae cyanobacterium]
MAYTNQVQTIHARRNPKTGQWEARYTGVCHISDEFIAEIEAEPGNGLEYEVLGCLENCRVEASPETKVTVICPESNW